MSSWPPPPPPPSTPPQPGPPPPPYQGQPTWQPSGPPGWQPPKTTGWSSGRKLVVGGISALVVLVAIGAALGRPTTPSGIATATSTSTHSPLPTQSPTFSPSPTVVPTPTQTLAVPTATLAPTPTQTLTAPTAPPTPTIQPPTAPPTTAPPPPTAAPTPEPDFFEFFDDTYSVPNEIPAGTYRTRESTSGCYWARLKGFSGDTDDIIANDFGDGYMVVTIKATDKGFESSQCDVWSSDLSQVTASDTEFGEGTFIVGVDIKPGTYRSSEGDGCYWARLSGFAGTINQIIANDFRTGGHAVVTIKSSDKGFQSSNCGDWTRQ